MTQRTLEECPGCGLVSPHVDQETPPSAGRFNASASCWAAYSEVLRREYESAQLFHDVHPLTADTYAAQHPVRVDTSLAVHLIRLHSVFELGYDTLAASARVRRFARPGADYEELAPYPDHCRLTIAHVLWATSELDHVRRVWEWAEEVWQSWEPHHAAIAGWAAREG